VFYENNSRDIKTTQGISKQLKGYQNNSRDIKTTQGISNTLVASCVGSLNLCWLEIYVY
jgi:hypothetical protein